MGVLQGAREQGCPWGGCTCSAAPRLAEKKHLQTKNILTTKNNILTLKEVATLSCCSGIKEMGVCGMWRRVESIDGWSFDCSPSREVTALGIQENSNSVFLIVYYFCQIYTPAVALVPQR
jgi:hypothetical protein